jgi:hypothetical protein
VRLPESPFRKEIEALERVPMSEVSRRAHYEETRSLRERRQEDVLAELLAAAQKERASERFRRELATRTYQRTSGGAWR